MFHDTVNSGVYHLQHAPALTSDQRASQEL
jgi:hypothetical protein